MQSVFASILDFDTEKEFKEELKRVVGDFRGLINRSQHLFALSWDDLAAESGLSVITLQNLADGTTMRPQLRTILALRETFMRFEHVYRVRTQPRPPRKERMVRTTRENYGDWRFQMERRKQLAKRDGRKKQKRYVSRRA